VVREALIIFLEVYLWGILFPRALLSWFPASHGGVLAGINSVLYRLTEPVLAPVRRLIPPARLGGMGLDLSFIIVFLGIQLILIPVVASL